MAVGDRVKIGDGSTFTDEVTVVVYQPKVDERGNFVLDYQGAATIQRLGGVKGGTTGIIMGPSIRVHRGQLHGEEKNPTGFGGVDLVHLFPVQLDYYQKVGWFPANHMRVIGGGAGMDISDKK